MEQAIGSQIADYILKPVNPNQVLLSLKKNLQEDTLVAVSYTHLDVYKRQTFIIEMIRWVLIFPSETPL